MFKEFVIGLVQGAFLGMLLSTLNIGLFGKMVFVLDTIFLGATSMIDLILFALLNIGFYYFFSRKSLKTNPMIFFLGLIMGVILL